MNKPKVRNPKYYRSNVGIMLLNEEGHVFVAKRIGLPDDASWQMPQGGIEDNESIESAAKRELQEECGITNIDVIKESSKWYYYDFPSDIQKRVWDGKYLGQRQKWFLMRFKGDASEINLLGQEEAEFQDWQWVKPHHLPELVIDFKRQVYEDLVHDFRDHLCL